MLRLYGLAVHSELALEVSNSEKGKFGCMWVGVQGPTSRKKMPDGCGTDLADYQD